MIYSVERFEGDLAVLCDDEENTVCVPREQLPAQVQEGDVLEKTDAGFAIDEEATEMRRALVRELQEKLRGRS